jgi:MFS family permease
MLLPLALTQFIASFAGSNVNVAIHSISKDLDTTIHGVQTAITLFVLCMAALMIPGSKVTDIWGRKRCLTRGLGLRRRGSDRRCRPGARGPDRRVLGVRGSRLGADDPADLHPRHTGI